MMKKIFFVLLITAGLNTAAQEKVSITDFKPLKGKWMGTLTYLDYTSGKPYTMSCNITVIIDEINIRQFVYDVEYPNEPKANGRDTAVINTEGKMIDDERVVSNSKVKEVTKIVTEKNGVDGNDRRKALFRYTYEFSNNSFSKRKEVLFAGEDKWILRNEYKMTR
jgi:hypothetical protein